MLEQLKVTIIFEQAEIRGDFFDSRRLTGGDTERRTSFRLSIRQVLEQFRSLGCYRKMPYLWSSRKQGNRD